MIRARFLALAVDYDGTLATHGRVPDNVVAALGRARDSGRKLVLVTGRTLESLASAFPGLTAFDRIVAENGALFVRPDGGEERLLSEPVPAEFVDAMAARGVAPLGRGRVIVATQEPHELEALEVIRELGLELQVSFNKGAVMILPTGITKATGLLAALEDVGLSPHNVVGVGDAENDHAFLDACECAVAVANALPSVKQRADIVTQADHGDGVVELIERLLEDDLVGLAPRLKRDRVALGKHKASRKAAFVAPFATGLLVTGSSKSGKSSFLLALIEQVQARGYQYCLIDPEGDHEQLPGAIGLGDAQRPPTTADVLEVLRSPTHNVCVSLLGVPGPERPTYFARLQAELDALHDATARPHWLIVDEAHHVLPRTDRADAEVSPPRGEAPAASEASPPPGEATSAAESLALPAGSFALVTLDAPRIDAAVLRRVTTVLVLGKAPREQLSAAAELLGKAPPRVDAARLRKGQGLLWRTDKRRARVIELAKPTIERRRHRRKYVQADLPDEQSFFFRGPNGSVSLRAANLHAFVELALGVDDETWQHHLHAGDYSRWINLSINDSKLARRVARIERKSLPPGGSRTAIRQLIDERYAPPA